MDDKTITNQKPDADKSERAGDQIPDGGTSKTKKDIDSGSRLSGKRDLKWLPFAAASLFILVLMLCVFAANSIFPFGSGTVAADDMVQQTIPAYVHFWDCLHKGSSLLWSWDTGGGIETLTFGFYVLKPVNIIFVLLCPRDKITQGFSFLVIVFMILSACSMIYFLQKRFRTLPVYWQTAFGILYAMSAYVMQYYTQIGWFDLIIMLPLIVCAALYMADTGKWLPYLLLLAYTTADAVYMSFMVFIFLFLAGGLYIIFMQPKDTKKMTIIRFGLTSVSSLILSAGISLPTAYYLTDSSRYETASEKVNTFSSVFGREIAGISDQNVVSAFIICQTAVLWAIFIISLFYTKKKDIKKTLFFVFLILTVTLPAFFEGIDLVWHKLSYRMFPMRFGYMVSFVLVCAAAYSFEALRDKLHRNKGLIGVLFSIASVTAGTCGLIILCKDVLNNSDSVVGLKYNDIYTYSVVGTNKTSLLWMTLSFVLIAVGYVLCMFNGFKKISSIIMALVMTGEVAAAANSAFRLNASNEKVSAAYSLDYVKAADEMYDEITVPYNALSRIKDAKSTMNNNYPLILGCPALSNFTHSASGDLTGAMENLGYSQVYTRIVDNGGTLFTDALLGIKYTMQRETLSDSVYTYIQDLADEKLYANNYTFKSGILVTKDFIDESQLEEADKFALNNKLCTELYGVDETPFTTQTFVMDSSNPELDTTLTVKGTKELYLQLTGSKKTSTYIILNGEMMDFSYFTSEENTLLYPNTYNNGLIDLGTFTDETVSLYISTDVDSGKEVKATVGSLDTGIFSDVCSKVNGLGTDVTTGKRSISAQISSPDDSSYLFIPVCYDKGWSCTVNGEKAEITEALGSFMAVKLNEGENDIEMRFTPYGMKTGIAVTVIFALMIAAYWFLRKKKPVNNTRSDLFLKIVNVVYTVAVAAVFAGMYVVPVFYSIWYTITS